jgi:hypothetical protein
MNQCGNLECSLPAGRQGMQEWIITIVTYGSVVVKIKYKDH